MGKQARPSKLSANIISNLEERRARWTDELNALESVPSDQRNKSQNKKIETLRKRLVELDQARYNWLGLEKDEELSSRNFIRNMQAVMRQRKAGLATAIKGAIGMKVLGADPLISNAWAGALGLRDMFRGQTSEENIVPGAAGGTGDTVTRNQPSVAEPSSQAAASNSLMALNITLLSNISETLTNTHNLLNWVYTYRRSRWREIRNLDSINKEADSPLEIGGIPIIGSRTNTTEITTESKNGILQLVDLVKGGLFGSPKLLGSEGPIASSLNDIRETLLKQTGAIEDLEPTEEESREASMLEKINRWVKGKGTLGKNVATLGTAGGGAGGFIQNVLSDTIGSTIGARLGPKAPGAAKGLIPAIGGAIPKLGSIITKVRPGLAIGGLATFAIMGAMDMIKGATYKHKEWGVGKTSGALGALFAGTGDRGIASTFSNMGKWAGLGAAIGSVVPIVGTIGGGLIGAALGGILSLIGGQRISRWLSNAGKWLKEELWGGLKNWVANTVKALLPGKMPVSGDDDPELNNGHPTVSARPTAFGRGKGIYELGNDNEFLKSSSQLALLSQPSINTTSIAKNEETNFYGKSSSLDPSSPFSNSAVATI